MLIKLPQISSNEAISFVDPDHVVIISMNDTRLSSRETHHIHYFTTTNGSVHEFKITPETTAFFEKLILSKNACTNIIN